MSFHSTLTAAGVWPADLATAGVVALAGRVYAGRRPASVTSSAISVWLERLPSESVGMGMQRLTRYPYLVHVMNGDKVGGSTQAYTAQLGVVEAHLQTLVERYSGGLPFVATITTIVGVEAQEGDVDSDPQSDHVTGTVRVTFTVRG